MQRFQNMPINRKLTAVILLTCTSALLLAGVAMIGTEVLTSRRAMASDLTVMADLLARHSRAALAFHREEDAEEANRILAALAADSHIVVACLYDHDGLPFGTYVRSDAAAQAAVSPGTTPPQLFPPRAPQVGQAFTFHSLRVVLPVMMDGQRIGTIFLHADLGRMYSDIALHASIVALVLLATIVITLGMSPRLRRPIAEPILALAGVARQVAEAKDYSARAAKQSEDEVGLLTGAFNQMLDEIETTQSSLQSANESMKAEIAERKAVEDRLRNAMDELAVAKNSAESANRAKDQFIAVLSHELRTPLTPVMLTLSLLQKDPQLSPSLNEGIQSIRRHVELEARLIDDLLDLTRITRGKLQLNFEIVDAHLLLADALKICCADRMQEMTLSLDAAEHHVRADPARFLQIFWNLLNNALKFTPVGRGVTVRSSNPAPRTIRIEVIDNGVGISSDVLPRIFNAFEQGDSSFTRTFGGLGLGLAIARALVDGHGGRITATSAGSEQGASFIVEMPAIASPDPRSEHPPQEQPMEQNRAAGLRVLLVEDHDGTLRLMSTLLSRLGHSVKSAASAGEALAIAKDQTVDLVVSDIGLPDGDGLQLMRELREKYGLRGICLSGYGSEEDIARSLDAGFIHHLVKPIDFEKLKAAIVSAMH